MPRIMAVESRRVATTVQQKKWHANINNNNNNNGIVSSSGRKEAKGSTITILDVRTGYRHTDTGKSNSRLDSRCTVGIGDKCN